MNIEQKIASAKATLNTAASLIKSCFDQSSLQTIQTSLFEKVLARTDLSDKQKEDEIDIITTGILVTALSDYQTRFKHLKDKNNPFSPYLWDNGDLKPYYAKEFKEVQTISGVHTPVYDENLILSVGTKVMNGKLPFKEQILNQIFDKHKQDLYDSLFVDQVKKDEPNAKTDKLLSALKEHTHELEKKINKKSHHYTSSILLNKASNPVSDFYKIQVIFDKALDLASYADCSQERERFMDGIEALKKVTLDNFKNKEANFTFDDCKCIATSTETLAKKIKSNTVTKEDINQFTEATKKYKTSESFAKAVVTLISTTIKILTWIATLGQIGQLSFWKKEPLDKISSAATDMLNKKPNT